MSDRLVPAPKLVWQNDYYAVLVDAQLGIVWNVRSSKPFASLDELDTMMGAVVDYMDGLDRPRYSLLLDIRAGPGRNDPEFEAAIARLRLRWFQGFRRIGVLVQTVVGAMQAQRYARQDGIRRMITSDEAALLRYLTQP
ncbi:MULTISPECIES: hypothetical protein [Sorangium]|uniref:STAS/SEC14 domain-containing protein n=1 Tax=Sorangium cellulosum TaxID=56 RepID=A0A4P2QWP7_SORCE|nr:MULTISPECIES: hypothetical protein [Sorangium]AUX34930.1 hypothetical protein SOCE836_071100 [Sorangium cellulosum]WCQ94237.1 hypothetical protein NQZ70_06994 [Sorangium sp. Soce836]